MVRRGPLITLAAVVVLAAVLLAVNVSKEDGGPTPPAPGPAATSAPAPTTTAAPSTAVAFPAQATYVAQIPVATGTLTLAIAVEGEDAVAYACDGSAVESWLSGDAEDGRLELEGRDDARLDGEFDGTTVRGTLWLGDRSWTFDAAPAEPPAGLYLANVGDVRASWIVTQDGTVTGVRRAGDGGTAPAPALAPDGTAVVDGVVVTADPVSGSDTF
ncbi:MULTISPECIES: hypothetical protein [unclassified Rhodococcus (in: high G+C Gram-positive bacteria)]|uniref:hypothetical protein n=1 Tax=unclassified Rhodococcus (in: high G+C Gram-positive bacteria) TaxID=192944 RepID=UPI0009259A03|nr:hypothetical protein [Rhodococcus sp. M8]OLL16960.1 hypothetical protein BKE56_026950 [Rhodococcus sp. M8]QPG47035.1 hypothetical protein ISO16_08585 [Rhodococcus sp. M8]